MASYKPRENEPFETAMRKFKRKVEADNILQTLRDREYYEKPTTKRKRAKAAAIKRNQRTLRDEKNALNEMRSMKKPSTTKKRY